MSYAELIEKLQVLPPEKQAEVFDFVEFLAARFHSGKPIEPTDWTDREFAEFSMQQALREMEDEPELYSLDDLKERWR